MINKIENASAERVATILHRRGFNYGEALRAAKNTTSTKMGDLVREVITEEDLYERRYEERNGHEPMLGLAGVDYSDIQAEFERFGGYAYRIDAKRSEWRGIHHIGKDAYQGLRIYTKCGSLIAHAFRDYYRMRAVRVVHVRPKRDSRVNASKSPRGFSDAIYSVIKDVDLYDPQVEVETFMKYLLIRQDFIGGSCHHCKSDRSTVIGRRGKEDYMYLCKCNECWGQFTPRTGTMFQKSRLSFPKMFDVIRLALDPSGIPYREISQRTGVHYGIAHDIGWTARSNSVMMDRWPGEHFGVDRADRKSHTAAGTSRAIVREAAKDKASTLPLDGGEPQRA